MALYIRDKAVADLARKAMEVTGARSLTETVRAALTHEIARGQQGTPRSARLRRFQAEADAIGPTDPAFDQKAFMDEMWGRR